MSGAMYMVRVPFRGARLFELARRRGLKTHDLDQGYATHCALRELFGDVAPQPFALEAPSGAIQPVLGYTTADAATLREAAQLKADPWLWDHLVDWENLAAKPLPTAWREGQLLDFSVRATPIARAAKDHPNPRRGPREPEFLHRQGSEVDVFLLACRAQDSLPDREALYREWLLAQFARHGGASVERVEVESFQIDRLSRRHHAEDARKTVKGRPDVTFSGTLTVRDPLAFRALLARGIGRHRAFGFGMLLLRPPAVR